MELIFLWRDVRWKKRKSSVAEAEREGWRRWRGVMDEVREEAVARSCRALGKAAWGAVVKILGFTE